MDITPESLHGDGYVKFKAFRFDQLVYILLPYFKKINNVYIISCYLATLLPLLVIVRMAVSFEILSFKSVVLAVCIYSMLIVIILIPIHEWIHGMAYKFLGAPKVSYGAIWRQMVFFAAADRFVVNYNEFKILALAPFIVISGVLIALYFLLPVYGQVVVMGVLSIHSLCCLGDFGLLAFFSRYKSIDLVTFDDVTNQTTYFFSRNNTDSHS